MILKKQKYNLKQIKHGMSPDIKKDLFKNRLFRAYHNRPPYQQNDYVGWILKAKKEETRKMRIQQMIKELSEGDTYMKMSYNPNKF